MPPPGWSGTAGVIVLGGDLCHYPIPETLALIIQRNTWGYLVVPSDIDGPDVAPCSLSLHLRNYPAVTVQLVTDFDGGASQDEANEL